MFLIVKGCRVETWCVAVTLKLIYMYKEASIFQIALLSIQRALRETCREMNVTCNEADKPVFQALLNL